MTASICQDSVVSLNSSLCLIFHIQSLSNYSHFNFQNISGLCLLLWFATMWSTELPPSLSALQQLLAGISTSLFSYNSMSPIVTEPQKLLPIVIFHNSHNSTKHLVFDQCLFLVLPSSDPISDEASVFSMFRSSSPLSFSNSFFC